MVQLPPQLAIYHESAEISLAKDGVKDIEFSGSTYQVLVKDPDTAEECWVFMQLEGKEQIRDAFCSCEKEDMPGTSCLHIAIAYLSLFGSYSLPLHVRFARSLWNQLCQIYADHLGDDSAVLIKLQPGYYISQSAADRIIFSLKGLTSDSIEYIENLLTKRPQETEETSLKFSNLPSDELVLWREGRPSRQLRYEMSYWSDLAKWFLSMQEKGIPYSISFNHSRKGIPNWIQIHFSEIVDIGFYISEANLPVIIPSLATVKSPLSVRNATNQGIAQITYHKKTGELHIEGQELNEKEGKRKKRKLSGIEVDGWLFVPDEGFYAEEPHILLKTPIVSGEALAEVLTEHTRLISTLLTDCMLHVEPTLVSYKLFFDKNWNLHITCYVFEVDDLSRGYSRLIGDWAYLDDDGFYRLEGKRFEEVETVISLYHVADFITQNRVWLNNQEGFHTHVKSIEYQLTYQVNANNRLTFSRILAKARGEGKTQDFGSWVYVEGYGFYSKTVGSFSSLLKPGISLSAEQIPLFIKMNRDELVLVPGFFSERCPVKQTSLKVKLVDKRAIHIEPHYELLPGYAVDNFRAFDDFVYVEEEGFYELPLSLRLPEAFRHPVEIERESVDLFLTYELDEIRKYISELDPCLDKPKEIGLMTNQIVRVPEKGRGWYRFGLYYQTDRGVISISDLYQAIKKKQHFGFFKAGLLDVRDKRFDWLRQLSKDRIERKTETVLLTALEFMRLNAFDPITLMEEESSDQTSRELWDELTQLHTPEEPDIGGLISHLRPYQEIGVRWLWFLYQQQLSGLLCDDMGLGKTHQAMALIASIANLYRSYAEGTACHFLVVCPTSVIYHWQDKLQQFLPGLRVCTFYGTNRSLEEFHSQYDVLLTSYGILRNEKELLSKVPFEVAIFDEIQVAKNQLSRVYAALLRIKAHMKLGLTGTPIENHLRELKSLFDIVLPSYMPAETEYREFFIRPIEKEHNNQRKKLLSRFIHPFILRRKKEDVLRELPEKIEEISYCDLLPYQYQLYSEVLEQRRQHLIEELRDEKTPIPYLHIFSLLSSLKQICDHPAVYLKMPQDYQKYASGKWNLFVELLREARESEQKIVVFSQYLYMLDIIEHHLMEQRIGFASLRGSTKNRKDQLQLFNQDPSCEVFVGSLHAAGLGVDLTAGSVVIHYDRWWNAARENQATDRVHRIGQTRGVQVFKLVTKGTFEEKIDAMIERKGQLMEDVVGVDDQHALKQFSRSELMNLLAVVDMGEEHMAILDTDTDD